MIIIMKIIYTDLIISSQRQYTSPVSVFSIKFTVYERDWFATLSVKPSLKKLSFKIVRMDSKILYLVPSLLVITTSDLSCSVGNGCSDSASCDVEFVADQVYGCGGIWTHKGVANGEYLCGDGYTICVDADQASGLGLTSELCSSTSIELNNYYVSLAGADSSGSDQYTCTEDGINNLFGCANPDSDAWIITDSTEIINCGPFGKYLYHIHQK